MNTKSVPVRITGRVQGVFYRAWTRETAIENQISGWVRNNSDGSVEAVFSGEAVRVDRMMELCRLGPPASAVDNIEMLPDTQDFKEGFEIRR